MVFQGVCLLQGVYLLITIDCHQFLHLELSFQHAVLFFTEF